jgi:hypothetical protein
MTLSRLLANLFVLFAFATGSGFAQEVVISEFMAHNETVLSDQVLEYSDWVELHGSRGGTRGLGTDGQSCDAVQVEISLGQHRTLRFFPGAVLWRFAERPGRGTAHWISAVQQR